MSPYRQFAAREAQLGEQWAGQVMASNTWVLGNPVGRGVSASRHVVCSDGTKGVAKIAIDAAGGNPNAAHEKIAADLAYLLELPVPPVTLWTDPASAQSYSISAWAFSQALIWDEAVGMMTPEYKAQAEDLVAAATVFHSWIADGDRHGGNTVVDAEAAATPRLAFIDHAYSMSFAWPNDATPLLNRASHHYLALTNASAAAIADVVSRVQSVSHADVKEIVERIPPAFLPIERKQRIVTNLLQRTATVPGLFGC